MSRLNVLYQQLTIERMASEAAARHRIPKATVIHPKGVIVARDSTLHENIKDPDYVPYCGPCVPFQRVRRVVDGFECPTCGNKSNWDLTKFNGNVDVQFEPEHAEAGEAAKQALQQTPHVPPPASVRLVNWEEDQGKKNTTTKPCGKCGVSFFGKRQRKFCVPRQSHQVLPTPPKDVKPWNSARHGNRRERRHGYY